MPPEARPREPLVRVVTRQHRRRRARRTAGASAAWCDAGAGRSDGLGGGRAWARAPGRHDLVMDEFAWLTDPEPPAADVVRAGWGATVAALPLGSRITGQVVGRLPFGVFVRIEGVPDARARSPSRTAPGRERSASDPSGDACAAARIQPSPPRQRPDADTTHTPQRRAQGKSRSRPLSTISWDRTVKHLPGPDTGPGISAVRVSLLDQGASAAHSAASRGPATRAALLSSPRSGPAAGRTPQGEGLMG
jgi:hypothetical protein